MFDTNFNSLGVEELTDNFFRLINNDWMLIAAGKPDDLNMMTASWGATGILWNKPIALCFIRPHRYTLKFVEKYNYFTLSFFDKKYKDILDFCGTHSGRDIDKVKQTSLQPVETPLGSITFKQARLVMECKKLYTDALKPENFLVQQIAERNYPQKDFHRFFIGEIEGCYLKKE